MGLLRLPTAYSGTNVQYIELRHNQLDVNPNRMTNVADPTSSQDAVTKKYLDSYIKSFVSVEKEVKGTITESTTHTLNFEERLEAPYSVHKILRQHCK